MDDGLACIGIVETLWLVYYKACMLMAHILMPYLETLGLVEYRPYILMADIVMASSRRCD